MEKIQTLKIENFSNSGEGIARVDGYVIFVENALPNDVVKVEITKQNKNFAKGKILEIIKPSENRVQPFCALYNACGACSLQHADYQHQLQLKKMIVQDAMKNIANLDIEIQDVEPSPKIREFRCKIQYPTAQTKVSKRILAGYYKPKSHEITNIKHCPIQPKICDEIIEFIRKTAQQLGISCYDEKKREGLLRHIVIRFSEYNNDILLTFVVNESKIPQQLKILGEKVFEKFTKIKGICVNFNQTHSNLILDRTSVLLCGTGEIEEKLLDKIFLIGPNTFFQVNPKSAENIFKYVKETIQTNHKEATVLDAYAGIASFGIIISNVAKSVISIEENPNSTALAQKVIQNNNIKNVEVRTGDSGEFLSTCKEKFDVIILDPPRKGCDELTLKEAMRLCKSHIIYVSCNPSTLARDLKYLAQNGAKILSVKPFDMFCHSLHVESVAIIQVG